MRLKIPQIVRLSQHILRQRITLRAKLFSSITAPFCNRNSPLKNISDTGPPLLRGQGQAISYRDTCVATHRMWQDRSAPAITITWFSMAVVLKIDPRRQVVYSAFYGKITDRKSTRLNSSHIPLS